jgi:hypothetical protein
MKTLTSKLVLLISLVLALLLFTTGVSAQCVNPTDDYMVNSDVTFCSGTFELNDGGTPGIIIINADDVTVTCLGTVIEPGDGTSTLGINITNHDNVVIHNCTIQEYDGGVHIDKHSDYVNLTYNNISAESLPIAANGNFSYIAHNNITDEGWSSAIIIEGNNVTIFANNISWGPLIISSVSSGNNITGNTLNPSTYIDVDGSTNNLFSNNKFMNAGIQLISSASSNTIIGNSLNLTDSTECVYVSADNNDIIGNNFLNCEAFLTGADNNRVMHNTMNSSGLASYSVYLGSSATNNTIYNNTANEYIRLSGADNNNITANNITLASFDEGIYIDSDNNIVEANILTNADLYIHTAEKNNVLKNNIVNTTLSTSKKIHDNSGSTVNNTVIYSNEFAEINWTSLDVTDATPVGLGLSINPTISYNFVEGSFTGELSTNATITFYGVNGLDPLVSVYRNDALCNDLICSAVKTIAPNIYSVNITGFSNYTLVNGSNSSLVIWDSNDPEGGGMDIGPSQKIKFYANYSNTSTGKPINNTMGGACNLTFASAPFGPFVMTYNSSIELWEYEGALAPAGTYYWNVSCVDGALYGALVKDDLVSVCLDSDGDGFNSTGVLCGYKDCDDTNISMTPPRDGLYINDNHIFCNGTYHVDDVAEDGLIFINASNINIICNNTIINGSGGVSDDCIMNDKGSDGFDNLVIDGCTITNYGTTIYLETNSNDINITNNQLHATGSVSLQIKGHRNYIAHNNITRNMQDFTGSTGHKIINNTILTTGAIIVRGNDYFITNNTVLKIMVYDNAYRHNITWNNVTGTGIAIDLADTYLSRIQDNTVSSGYMELDTVKTSNITRNTIIKSASYGIRLISSSTGNRIENNTLSDSAITIDSGPNTIIGNLITRSTYTYGLDIDSDSNTVRNNVLNNSRISIALGHSDNLFENNTVNTTLSTNAKITDSSGVNRNNTFIYSNEFGKINWTLLDLDEDNALGLELGKNPVISYNFIEGFFTDKLNGTAQLFLYNVNALITPVVYRNAVECNLTYCSNLISLGGDDYTFNVTQFSNFTLVNGSNATLSIWDDNDAKGGSQNLGIREQVLFYANYSNRSTEIAINNTLGGSCNIIFNVSPLGWSNMVFNATSQVWDYNRSFSTRGDYEYNITCNAPAHEWLNLTDDITILCRDDDNDGFNQSGTDCGLADCNDNNASVVPPSLNFKINRSIMFCNGTYVINAGISVMNVTTSNITIQCNNTIMQGDTTGEGILSVNHNNVTIKDCTIRDYLRPLYIQGADGYNISNNILAGAQTAIRVDNSCANVTIQNNTINNISLVGIWFNTASLGNKILDNSITNSSGAGGDAIVILGPTSSTTISRNTITSTEGIAIQSSNNTNITDNVFSSIGTEAIKINGVENITIVGNTIQSAQTPIEILGSSRIILANTTTTQNISFDNSDINITNLTITSTEAEINFELVNISNSETFVGNTQIFLDANLSGINTGSGSGFNATATITLNALSFDFTGFPALFRNGVVCPITNCIPVSKDVMGTFIFTVTQFSNYSASGNSNLSIYDSNDTEGGGIAVITGMQANFTANYTNITSGNPITNLTGNCSILFSQNPTALPIPMTYNSTLGIWHYNRSFASQGIVTWDVTCNSTIYQDQFVSDTIPIIGPGGCTDNDGDGFNSTVACGIVDCDDNNSSVFPPTENLTISSDVMFCNGTYALHAGVISSMSSNTVVECNNTIIVGNQSTTAISILSGVNNISIFGCELTNYSLAFALTGINNSNVSSNIIRNMSVNSVEIEGYAYNNTFFNNTFEDITGIAITALHVHSGNQFLDNNFADISQQSIKLYNLTTGNTVANNNLSINSGDVDIFSTNNTNITGNAFVGSSIILLDATYSFIDSNTVNNGAITDNGGSEASTYVGNSVGGSGGTSIIDINSHRANVTDNFVTNGGANGIFVNGSNCVISSNDLMSHIYLFGGIDSNITNNNLSMTSGYAIRLKGGSHNNNISGHNITGTAYIAIEAGVNNDIENNNFTGTAINLFINPGNNRVHNNIFTNNSGINLSQGGSVNITNNNFTLGSAAPAIILDGSSNNIIEDNFFYNGRIVLLTKSGLSSENNSLINNTMNTSAPGNVKLVFANTVSAGNNVTYENNNGRIDWSIGLAILKNENSALGFDNNNPIINNNFVSFTPAPAGGLLNRTARITLSNLNYDFIGYPALFRNGAICPNAICTPVSFDGSTFVFTITQFSNYSSSGNSNLTIYDSNDTEGGGIAILQGMQANFTANFTNVTDNTPITNLTANCTIEFSQAPNGPLNMTYNATLGLWTYNRSFLSVGTVNWNVTCNSTIYQDQFVADTIPIGAVSCTDGDSDGYNSTGGVCGPIDCNDADVNIWPLTNQTSGLNAAIVSISNNTVLCPGTYQFELTGSLANIFSFEGNDLELDCNYATIISNASGRAVNASSTIENITIKNCNIHNFTNVFYGVGGQLTNDLTIDNCNLTFANVYFIPDTNAGLGLVVRDSLINASFGNLYAATVNYTNTTFAAYTRISNSNSVIDSCTFLNNTDVYGATNLTISNNNISADFDFGMGASGSEIIFENNDIYSRIIFEIADSADITNNRIHPSSTQFHLQGENKLMQNNTFFAPATPRATLIDIAGVGIHSLNNSEIKNNIFNSTGLDYTIRANAAVAEFNLKNVTIVGNTFISDGGQAIFVRDSVGYLNITGNTFISGNKYLYSYNYTEQGANVILQNENLTALTGSDLIYLKDNINVTLTNLTISKQGLYTNRSNLTITNLTFTNTNGTIFFPSAILNETEEFNSSTQIFMENNLAGINIGSGSGFNTTATVTLNNLNFGFIGLPAILRNGALCPGAICTPVSFVGSAFTFTVNQFSNYSASGNSNLSIYDSNDPEGGGVNIIIGMQANFTANYTNITSGNPITNLTANCSVNFSQAPNGPFNMTYNATLGLWSYNRSFASEATVNWIVTCNSTIYQDQVVADTIPIGLCLDNDGDGFNLSGTGCGPVDCDDNNASIIPLFNGTIGVNNTLNNITSSVLICKNTYNFWLNGTGTAAYELMSYAINIGADDVVLDCNGSTIIGNSSNTGIAARLAYNNITIKNCNISNFTLGVAGVTTFMATDLTIQNNTFTNDNSYAITGSYATNLILIDNDVDGTNDPTVEVGQQNNFNITNNIFRANFYLAANEHSIIDSNTFLAEFKTNTNVNNVTISVNNFTGVIFIGSTNNTFNDNYIYNESYIAASPSTIINNTVYSSSDFFQIQGDNFLVQGNTFYAPTNSRTQLLGIRTLGGAFITNTEIRSNTINSTNVDYAIGLYDSNTIGSTNITVINNTIISNDIYAIYAPHVQGYLNLTGNNYVGGQGGYYIFNATDINSEVIIKHENLTAITTSNQIFLDLNRNITITNLTVNAPALYINNSNITITNLTLLNNNGEIFIPSIIINDTEEFNSSQRVFLQNNLIGIDTESSQTGFNTSAELTFNGLSYPQTPYLLKDGVRCDDTDACNISYDNANNILYANVSSFSNYSSAASAVSQPNLTISKTDTPDPVLNGSFLNYTITITNIGGGNATNITLIETYSGNTTFNTSNPLPDSGTNNTFSLGNLTTNQTVLVNITVLVNNSVTLGTTLTNLVNVTYFNTTNDTQMIFTQENTTVGITSTALNVTLISPPNANFTNSNDVTFTCNATDSQNVTNITLYHNISQSFGVNQSINTSGTNVQAQFNVTNIEDGNYTWNCLAYNNQSNTSFAPNNFTFVVDTTNPVVNVGFNDSNVIFNKDIIRIDWNVTDRNINTRVFHMTLPNGSSVMSMDDSIDVILGPDNLTQEGNYLIQITGSDLAGNSVNTLTLLTVVGENPIVTLISPSNNNISNITNVTFICNASDNTEISNISLYYDISQSYGLNQTLTISGSPVQAQFNVTNMPDGNHTWNCLGYDNESNTNFAPSNFSFIIDTTPPNVSKIFPTRIDQSTRTNMFANVSDNVALDSCNLFISGNLEGAMTINESAGTANRTIRINNVGTKVMYANCTDLLGFSTFNLTNVTVIESFFADDDDDDDDDAGDDDEADNDDDGDNDDDDGRGDNDDDDDDDDWLPEPLIYNIVFTQLVINDLLTAENETPLDPIFIKDNSTVTVELYIKNTGTGNLTDITVDIEDLLSEVRLTSISPKYSAELTTDETGYFVAILKTSTLKKPFTMNIIVNTAELERSISQKVFLEKIPDQDPTTTIERVVTQTRSFVVHSYKWLLLLLLLPLLFFIQTTTYGDETAIRNLIESRGIKKYRKIHVPDAVYFKYHEVHNLEPIRLSQSQRNEAKQFTQIYKITYDLAALLVLAQRQLIPRVVTTSYLPPNLKKEFRRIIFVDPKLKRIIRRLHKYIIAEKKKGFSTTAIRDKLLIAGWPKKYINQFIMPGDILEEYIEKEHKDGFTDSQIRSSLVQAGWDKKTVYNVLDPRKELVDYVKKERKKGFDDHAIRLKLLKSGFKKDVIDRLI